MELIPNFHWIKGLASNIYLLTGQNGHVVLDSGYSTDLKRIERYFLEQGLEIRDITAILITHADIDHAGTVSALQSVSGARVISGRKTAEYLKYGKSPKHTPLVLRLISDLLHYRAVSEEALEIVENREYVEGIADCQALYTPGHSEDHFSFFFPSSGLLAAGDALFARGQLDIGRPFLTGNRSQAISSAVALLKLTPAVIACGHGPPVMNHSADELMMLRKKLEA